MNEINAILKKRLSTSENLFKYSIEVKNKRSKNKQFNKKCHQFKKQYPNLKDKSTKNGPVFTTQSQQYDCKSSFCCPSQCETVQSIQSYYSIGKTFFHLPKISQKLNTSKSKHNYNQKYFQQRKHSLFGQQNFMKSAQKSASEQIQQLYQIEKNRISQKMKKLSVIRARLKLLDKIERDKKRLIEKIYN